MSKAEEKAQAAYPAWRNGIGDEFNSNSAYYGFIEGYNQAEKDLDVVSLVKEVSGVKELSRAKEEALKAYPPQSITANYDTINRRDAFEYGYLKAEKDLELTWKDLALIRLAFDATEDNINHGCLKISKMTKEYYEEVLKRFKAQKIEEAAKGAADLYEQDLPMMSYDEDTEVDGQHHFCQEFGAELFKDGAKWAINEFLKDLWHDASEEPKPNMELICVGQYGNPLVLSSNSDSFKSRDISKWAYFNDLLNLSNVQRTVKNWKEPLDGSPFGVKVEDKEE